MAHPPKGFAPCLLNILHIPPKSMRPFGFNNVNGASFRSKCHNGGHWMFYCIYLFIYWLPSHTDMYTVNLLLKVWHLRLQNVLILPHAVLTFGCIISDGDRKEKTHPKAIPCICYFCKSYYWYLFLNEIRYNCIKKNLLVPSLALCPTARGSS